MPGNYASYPLVESELSAGARPHFEEYGEVAIEDILPGLKKGEIPESPIEEQHPAIGPVDRRMLNSVLTPEAADRFFRKHGLEGVHLGGRRYAVRRPGEREWRTVDPDRADWGDVLDIVPHIYRGAASAAGATSAALAAAPSGPGAILAGMGGGAGGAAAAETSLQAAAKLLGYEPTLGEAARQVGTEAAFGAAGEGLFRAGAAGVRAVASAAGKVRPALNRAGQALQTPLKRETAKRALGREVTREQATRSAVRQAGQEIVEPRQAYRGAQVKEAAVRSELAEAAAENRREVLARIEAALPNAERGIAEGKRLAAGAGSERAVVTKTVKKTVKMPGEARLDLPSEIARPDWGLTANALKDNPEVGAILRKHFGEEFVPVFSGGGKRGSHAMLQRESRLRQLIAERGAEWSESAGTGFAQDLASYMLSNPEFRAGLSEATAQAFSQAARGTVTRETARTVVNTVKTRLQGRLVTPRLRAAQEAAEAAKLERLSTNARRLETEQATLDPARRAHESQMARTAAARAAHSRLAPHMPYADFGARWLSGSRFGPAGLGATAGASLAGAPGAIAGAALGALASEPIKQVGRRGLATVGRMLMSSPEQGLAWIAARSPPAHVAKQVARLREVLNRRGIDAFRVAVHLMLQAPAVRAWAEREAEREEELIGAVE